MNEANTQAGETMTAAEESHMEAEKLRDEANEAGTDMEEILTKLGNFIAEENRATPEEVIQVSHSEHQYWLP